MQTHTHGDTCCDAGGRSATRLLLLVFVGMAFVLNAYFAKFVYPDNALVGDVSALIGALILAAPIFRTALIDIYNGRLHMNELVALAVLAAMAQGDFRTAGVVAFFMLMSLVIEIAHRPGRPRRHREPDPPDPHHRPAHRRGRREEEVAATDLQTSATASGCCPATTCPPTAPSSPVAPP